MEYHYLACDGPNCDRRRELLTQDAGDAQDTSNDSVNDGSDADTTADQSPASINEPPAVGDETGQNDEAGAAYEPLWLSLDTGGRLFHFCTYDCLKAFVNDPAAPNNALRKYAEFFGYQS